MKKLKDPLTGYPDVENEWFQFKAARDKEKVKDWLESTGIELDDH
jgi:hypothetical protein